MPAPTRTPLIAGNWKLHKTLSESRDLASEIVAAVGPAVSAGRIDVGIFPSAINLAAVAGVVADSGARALVGAQNLWFEAEGAFTGENSAGQIRGAGGNSVLIGHSERRHVFGESDEWIGKKVLTALEADLVPILCVGELLEERDAGKTNDVVASQLRAGISQVTDAAALSRVIIAYEPVWAIGTGRTATPEQAQEVHAFVRRELREAFGSRGGDAASSDATRILYGGSVKPENAGELLSCPDIDGALVGGASLKTESFVGICNASA